LTASKLAYFKSGNGQHKLLIFHGFGQNHSIFNEYLTLLADEFTCYSFDIYYHGDSVREDNRLNPNEWKKSISEILMTENISSFSLLSFSLGGRFCIATLIAFPKQIDQMILLAPDGIYQSVWFKIATAPVGNQIFKFLMNNEGTFDRWLELLEKSRLASHSIVKFARKELSTSKSRQQVYKTWTYFKGLQYSNKEIRKTFSNFAGQIHVILGAMDTIVPIERIETKISGIPHVKIHIIAAKHNHMIVVGKLLVSSLLKRG
jgi:pimeloyl-ACP methyl ester carboxylesterase